MGSHPTHITELFKRPLTEIARAVTGLFSAADNVEIPGLLDLDPREGYVRLAATRDDQLLSFGIESVQGLMNPHQEFQALLEGNFGRVILTRANESGNPTLTLMLC